MNWTQALEALMEGKYVTREAWEALGEYLVHMPGMPNIWKIMTKPNPNAGGWFGLLADLMAEDWKIVERHLAPVPDAPVSQDKAA